MASSTPRRIYGLRSSEKTAGVELRTTSLRKRVSDSSNNGGSQKRQRTHQSYGPAFSSPDAIYIPRFLHAQSHKAIANLPTRLAGFMLDEPYGTLGSLPKDVVFHLMSRTEYHLLGHMAMTSNAWMEMVYAYVESGSFRVRWLADISRVPENIPECQQLFSDPFYSMAKLLRLMSFNHVWDARLAFFQSFLKLAYKSGASLSGLSRMIRAFSENPDEDIELDHIDGLVTIVFEVVPELKEELSSVITRSDDDRLLADRGNLKVLQEEMKIRQNTLRLFLNHGSTDPSVGLNKFFLSSLMKVFKNLHGTLPRPLFYLLFGPTSIHNGSEVIHWHRLSQVSVNTLEDSKQLKMLSKSLYALLLCRNLKNAAPWTKNTIFNLMEEITTYPSPWSMNTFVSLQVLEPELVPIGVIARMHRSHEGEAGDIICTMKMLLHRWQMDVQGVMDSVLDNIKSGLKPAQRRSLFDQVWDWHQKNIEELQARSGRYEDIRIEIESQIEMLPVLRKLL